MTPNISLLAATLATTLFMFSCKKDDNGSINGNGNQTGIAGMKKQIVGTWKIESKSRLETDINGKVTTTDILNACEKDDTYTFTENFYSANGGSVACSYPMSYNTQFQWTLYNDSTFQFNYGPGFSTNPRMDFVNATTMQLSARSVGISRQRSIRLQEKITKRPMHTE